MRNRTGVPNNPLGECILECNIPVIKAEFSASLLQSSVSHHSNMIQCSRNISVVLLNIFLETMRHLFQDSLTLMNRKFQRTVFI